MILADGEALGDSNFEKFASKIGASVKVCVANMEAQQAYIDLYRQMAKSGLLTLPEK